MIARLLQFFSRRRPTREQEILARHSTPGLRKTELTRQAKKDHLLSIKTPAADVEKNSR